MYPVVQRGELHGEFSYGVFPEHFEMCEDEKEMETTALSRWIKRPFSSISVRNARHITFRPQGFDESPVMGTRLTVEIR